MRWLTKPRIRHYSMEFAGVWIDWVVDFPGEVLPWPCRTWPDALDAVGKWWDGQLFAGQVKPERHGMAGSRS